MLLSSRHNQCYSFVMSSQSDSCWICICTHRKFCSWEDSSEIGNFIGCESWLAGNFAKVCPRERTVKSDDYVRSRLRHSDHRFRRDMAYLFFENSLKDKRQLDQGMYATINVQRPNQFNKESFLEGVMKDDNEVCFRLHLQFSFTLTLNFKRWIVHRYHLYIRMRKMAWLTMRMLQFSCKRNVLVKWMKREVECFFCCFRWTTVWTLWCRKLRAPVIIGEESRMTWEQWTMN